MLKPPPSISFDWPYDGFLSSRDRRARPQLPQEDNKLPRIRNLEDSHETISSLQPIWRVSCSSPFPPFEPNLESLRPFPGPGLKQAAYTYRPRSEEHTSELQSQSNLVCRLLLEKK